MTNILDEILVKKIIQGNTNHFNYIIEKYQQRIFSMGMRFFKNENDACDFVQEVFIKAYQNLASYKKKAAFRFWLIKIAYNHGINKVKKNQNIKKREQVLDNSIASEYNIEMIQMKSEAEKTLFDAIEKLPQKYRQCLDFYFFVGLTYNEISDITGFPVNTIKSHVYRAKQALHSCLQGTVVEDYYEKM